MKKVVIAAFGFMFILLILLGAGLYETDRKLRVLKRETKEMDEYQNQANIQALRLIHEADQRIHSNEALVDFFGQNVRIATEELNKAPELDEVSSHAWAAPPGHLPYDNFALWDGKQVPYHPYQAAMNAMAVAHAIKGGSDQATQFARIKEMLGVVDSLAIHAKCGHPLGNGMTDDLLFIPYPFDFMVGGKIKLPSGWVSAFAQGTWLAAYLDLYEATKDEAHLRSAQEVLASLACVRGNGGSDKWVSFIDGQNYLWFEEYPYDASENSIQVLNGHIWTVRALYKYHLVYPRDQLAEKLLRAGIATMRSYVHFYRHPGNANYYDLHLLLADYSVDRTLADQDWLAKVTGDPFFAKMKDAFRKDSRKEL